MGLAGTVNDMKNAAVIRNLSVRGEVRERAGSSQRLTLAVWASVVVVVLRMHLQSYKVL